jgi:hypothetical protein
VRPQRLDEGLRRIDAILAARVAAADQIYVPMMDVFADISGRFSITGPNVLGVTTRLRGPDGIHFSPAGQRKLAHFVEPQLRKLLLPRISAEADRRNAALGLPIAPGDGPGPDLGLGLLYPPSEGELPIPFPKALPALGAVFNLQDTTPAQSLLRTVDPMQLSETARNRFERGLPPGPEPGRIDAFNWPGLPSP